MMIAIPYATAALAAVSATAYYALISDITRDAQLVHGFSGRGANAFAHAYASAHLTYLFGENFSRTMGDLKKRGYHLTIHQMTILDTGIHSKTFGITK